MAVMEEKILILGGDMDSRVTLCEKLCKDYKVDIAESCEDTLNNIKNMSYSVVLIPIDRPGIKTIEVVHKFKEVKSEIPIIAITAHDSVELAIEAMKAGAYGYVTKPLNSDELKLVVLHALEWHKLVEEVKEKKFFQEMAILDGLTGIYNRRYFDTLLDMETKRALRYPQQFSLMMIDLDDFKKYNDDYGHITGDKLLKEIACFIASICRSTDFVTRYGGEEFGVILPQTDKKSASLLAMRIMLLVYNNNFKVLPDKRISLSIGVSTFGEDASTEELLVKHSDEALYRAKKLGKNRVCLFGLD